MKLKFLGSGFLLLSVVVILCVVLVLMNRDEHFTHDVPDEAPPVPEEVDQVSWEWEVPEENAGLRVLPGVFGPIAVLEDGVIALDGVSGDELWGYRIREKEDTTAVSAALTPNGGQVLVGRVHGESDSSSADITVLDSATGEVDERYTYEVREESSERSSMDEPVPDLRHLSDHTWVEPQGNGFIARDIASGEAAWEFVPEAGCSMVAAAASANFHGAGVGVTGDTYLVPLSCEDEASAGDGGDETAPGVLLALDAATGEERWADGHEVLLTASYYSDPGYFALRFNISVDQESFVARTEEGRTVFDIASGDVLYEDITDFYPEGASLEHLFYFSEGVIGTSVDAERTAHPLRLRMVDFLDGETAAEIELPEDYYARRSPSYFNLRPADLGSDAIALEEGLVITACDYDCPTTGGSSESEILLLFVPWDEGESASEFGLPGFTSLASQDILLPVPGAVVAYQLTPGAEVYDELIGLG